MVGAGCASLTATPLLSTITNLSLLNASASANRSIYAMNNPSNYKALVCIMLFGGNDSFNMLVPYDQTSYDHYKQRRGEVYDVATNPSGIALERNKLHQLDTVLPSPDGKQYAVHPNMPKIAGLFNDERTLSFIANVGTLTHPGLNSSNYANANLPYNLFSHIDQAKTWQTGIAEGFGKTGWGGRIADKLQSNNSNESISMNISVNGLNFFQSGEEVSEYVITRSGGGSVKLYHSDEEEGTLYDSLHMSTMDNIFDVEYHNILEKAYKNQIVKSKENSNSFYRAINGYELDTVFPNTGIGRQLEMVAKTIANRYEIGAGFTNQTFFVSMDGFDTHNNLLDKHGTLLSSLDEALYNFYLTLSDLGVLNQVTTFTMSDFARTLNTNGDGSDHAWGGHHFVMGGAVNGGKIFGEYPDLANNNFDIGGGRFIPTISCDQYFADLACWFGGESHIDTILPNLYRFDYDINAGGLGLFV